MNTLASSHDLELTTRLAEWKTTILAELKGASFEKKLITRTFEEIALSPLYTRADLAGLPDLRSLPGQEPYLRGARRLGGGRTWQIAQEIDASNPADYNHALLANLRQGQDAVVLKPDNITLARSGSATGQRRDSGIPLHTVRELAVALNAVDLRAVAIHLSTAGEPRALAALLLGYAEDQGIPFSTLSGSLTADPLADAAETGQFPSDLGESYDGLTDWTRWAAENAPNLRTVGINAGLWADAGATATQELAIALGLTAEYVRALLHRGIALDDIAQRIRFSFSVGPQFFSEIAKFRAFRPLWTRLLVAFGGDASLGAAGSLSASTGRWNKTLLDPHVNLLRATTEALSAVLGGCDSLSIAPFDAVSGTTTDVSRRIALNVHTLLAEEFGIAEPADPAGGSWYAEKLTDETARAAWTLFQDFEHRGGFAACLRTGYAREIVGKARSAKDLAVATRRLALIGTNLFPNQKEVLAPQKTQSAEASLNRSADATRANSNPSGARTFEPKCDFLGAIKSARQGAQSNELLSFFQNAKRENVSIPALNLTRGSEGFESIRRASAAFGKQTGARPKVFLAKMGPPRQHKARADFSAAFMLVGGFEILAPAAFDNSEAAAAAAIASGSPVVILCSTDETYPTLAPAFAQAIKAKNPKTIVVLAGLPGDAATIATFRTAGFDEFIHVRANAESILASFLTTIGAAL